MIRALCILSLAVATLALPQQFKWALGDHRIVNGTNVPQGKYPSQISLEWWGAHSCGGTILNENWVLTAAHCIDGENPFPWKVFAGNVDLYDYGDIHDVAEFIIHEDFATESLGRYINDIALVRVATPFTFGANVAPTTLPNQNQDTEGGTAATVVGWGYPYTEGDMMQILQEVDIFTYSDADCESIYNGEPHHPSNICAGVPEGGKGHCTSDSGGPLWVNGQQVGVASWFITPCATFPGQYTEVSWYVDWINSHIN